MNSNYDVIIPAYKGGKFLKNCILMHLKQTLPPNKIIFINDGDKELNFNMIKEYFKDHITKLEYYENSKNIGAINSLNLHFDKLNSKYFKISALDDICALDLAEESINLISRYPNAGLVCSKPGYFYYNENIKTNINIQLETDKNQYFNSDETKKLFYNYFFKPHSQNIFFNREFFLTSNLFNDSYGYMADLLNNYYIMLKYGFCYVPKNLSYYGVHKNQWSQQVNRKNITTHLNILNSLKKENIIFYQNLHDLNIYFDFPLKIFFFLKTNHKKFIKKKIILRSIKFNLWLVVKSFFSPKITKYIYEKFY